MQKNPSQVTVFSCFVGVLAASLLVAALISPLVFKALGVFPFHRVFNRIAMLVFLVGSVALVRKLGIGDRATLGFGVPFGRQMAVTLLGWCIGICVMAAVAVGLFTLGIREWKPASEGPLTVLLGLLPEALLSGVIVGLVEETFFRGAMYGAIRKHGSVAVAVILTAVLYSAVHFVGEKFRIPATDVTWSSGFVMLSKFFGAYSRPLTIADDFIALTLVGVLFAVLRERTGNLGMCIGLHAGFVTVIALLRKASVPVYDQPWSFLIGHTDGIVGWLVALMAAAATIVATALPDPKSLVFGRRSSSP